MNPWGCEQVTAEDKDLNLESFEDNFIPFVSDTLPDSKQYLDLLEKKLRKIKNDPNVVQQLSEQREDCMLRLLTQGSDIVTDETLALETPVNLDGPAQQLLRHIRPERQALTVGEAVEIIEFDYLDKTLEQEVDSDRADSASR